MRLTALLLLFGFAASPKSPAPLTPHSFQYSRQISFSASATPNSAISPTSPNACALLDAAVFAHTEPTLADLRLFTSYSGGHEAPFAITLSRTATNQDAAQILNQGRTAPRHVTLDLAMPARPYSSVDLALAAHDFLATARVTGLRSLDDRQPVYLGIFSVFDLTAQRLGRSTNLALSESTFPFLHLELTVSPAPGNKTLDVTPNFVISAQIPPSRVAQTLYTPIAETTAVLDRPRESVATFTIPAHVPVERVTISLDPAEHANFNRVVTISATLTDPRPRRNRAVFPVEQLSGQISRIRLAEAGQEVRQESLSIPAILGSNLQSSAKVEVTVENGDDRPLRIQAVRLEMRQRKLCFSAPQPPLQAPPGSPQPTFTAELDYGAPGVPSPVNDFGSVFNPADPVRQAVLEPEVRNPHYISQASLRPFNERHPEILWIALVATLLLLAILAWRSSKTLSPRP